MSDARLGTRSRKLAGITDTAKETGTCTSNMGPSSSAMTGSQNPPFAKYVVNSASEFQLPIPINRLQIYLSDKSEPVSAAWVARKGCLADVNFMAWKTESGIIIFDQEIREKCELLLYSGNNSFVSL